MSQALMRIFFSIKRSSLLSKLNVSSLFWKFSRMSLCRLMSVDRIRVFSSWKIWGSAYILSQLLEKSETRQGPNLKQTLTWCMLNLSLGTFSKMLQSDLFRISRLTVKWWFSSGLSLLYRTASSDFELIWKLKIQFERLTCGACRLRTLTEGG